jgi:hypothetical protein
VKLELRVSPEAEKQLLEAANVTACAAHRTARSLGQIATVLTVVAIVGLFAFAFSGGADEEKGGGRRR